MCNVHTITAPYNIMLLYPDTTKVGTSLYMHRYNICASWSSSTCCNVIQRNVMISENKTV